jgi:hypothetical protein
VLLSVFIDSLGSNHHPVDGARRHGAHQPTGTACGQVERLSRRVRAAQFFMAPIFGNISDRIGRRPVLL